MNYKNYIIEMADLSGMSAECIPHDVLVKELNRVNAWRLTNKKTRKTYRDDATIPRIHTSTLKIIHNDDEVQMIENFIRELSFDPARDRIVGTNEKIDRSGLQSETFVKIGIPAFKGILYDEEKQEFFVVTTCPGARGCQNICYAKRGNYLRYGSNFRKSHKILNYLINHPEQFEEQLTRELTDIATEAEAYNDTYSKVIVRYNESGDFFWQQYFDIAKRVIRNLKTKFNIAAKAYTKLSTVANDPNTDIDTTFTTSFGQKSERELVNPEVRLASILPKHKFRNLFVVNGKRSKRPTVSGMKILQDRIAAELGVPRANVINYQEMMKLPELDEKKYYVLVMSGDGDDAVTRKDVKEVILAEH